MVVVNVLGCCESACAFRIYNIKFAKNLNYSLDMNQFRISFDYIRTDGVLNKMRLKDYGDFCLFSAVFTGVGGGGGCNPAQRYLSRMQSTLIGKKYSSC